MGHMWGVGALQRDIGTWGLKEKVGGEMRIPGCGAWFPDWRKDPHPVTGSQERNSVFLPSDVVRRSL